MALCDICIEHNIVESARLPLNMSAQTAELVVLTFAFILGTGQNIARVWVNPNNLPVLP